MKKRTLYTVLVTAGLAGIGLQAQATQYRFFGLADTAFENANNWTNQTTLLNGVPGAGDEARIQVPRTCDLTTAVEVGALNYRGAASNAVLNVNSGASLYSNGSQWNGQNRVGGTGGGMATLNIQSNATVNLTGNIEFSMAGGVTSTGVVNIAEGGTLTVNQLDGIKIGDKQFGVGYLNLNGGSMTFSNMFRAGSFSGSTGIVNVTAGSLVGMTTNSEFRVGNSGPNTTKGYPATYGELNISGGSVVLTNELLAVGRQGVGVLDLSGGTLEAEEIALGAIGGGDGTYTQSGGTNLCADFKVGRQAGATGTVTIADGYVDTSKLRVADDASIDATPHSVGTFTMNGGFVKAGDFFMGAVSNEGPVSTVVLNGGELQVTEIKADSIGFSGNESFHIEGGVFKVRHIGSGSNNVAVVEQMIASNVLTWAQAPLLSGLDPADATQSYTNGTGDILFADTDGSLYSYFWAKADVPDYLGDWVAANGLTGSDTNLTANPDGDDMDNLMEYALGGNPTSGGDTVKSSSMYEEGGTNWYEYIYQRRLDRGFRGLTYKLRNTDNLVFGDYTNEVQQVGIGPIDAEFEAVTNRISTDGQSQEFLRLKIFLNQ